ncbi:MAG: hypothetical protein ACE5FY_07665, partial [Nitrospiria bacterium]
RLLDSNTRRLQDLAQEVEEAGQKSDPNLQLNLLRPLRRESKDLTRKQVVLLKNIELKEKQKFGNKIKNQNAKILTLQNQLSDLLNQNLKTLAQILAAKIT